MEGYLRSCPTEEDSERFLSVKCEAALCQRESHSSDIFINHNGEFRRRMETRLHCLSNQDHCLPTLTEYLDQNASKVGCSSDSFKNLDSGRDLQCSWTGLQQAECLQRMFEYQPTALSADQIICCRGSSSTVFSLSNEQCSSDHFSQCKQKWTTWSGWQVGWCWESKHHRKL